MVTFDTQTGSLSTSDPSLCRQGFRPGATFHVPALLIGMETGIWGSLDDLVPWDGQTREIAQWNQDQTVRRGFESACFPCFGQVMRTAGTTTVRQFLREFGYGNALPEPTNESFWVSGDLSISPLGQIEFLWRLDRRLLRVHEETRQALLQVFSLDHRDGRTRRGKSGRFASDTGQGAWMVGWLESGKRRYFFSLLLLGTPGEDLELTRTRILDEWLGGLVVDEQQARIVSGKPSPAAGP